MPVQLAHPSIVAACTVDADQEAVAPAADQTGGVFPAWCDLRKPDLDIHAQRPSSAGEPMWTDHRGIANEQSTDVMGTTCGCSSWCADRAPPCRTVANTCDPVPRAS
jgi:hypothetical protein